MINSYRQGMHIAITKIVENGDIDNIGPMAEESEKNEESYHLTPEATHHQKIKDLRVHMEKFVTMRYQ